MKIIDIKAMKYLEDGSVSCEVLFEGRADYIPYRAVEMIQLHQASGYGEH